MRRSGLIATKIGNSSFFNDSGISSHVTILKVDDCIVSNVKTTEKHGYTAVQLSSIDTKKDLNKINKPQRKNFSSINLKPKKIIKEFRVDNANLLEIGTKLNVKHFKIRSILNWTQFSRQHLMDTKVQLKL